MKTKLNGWRRLWLVATLAWLVAVGVTDAKLFQTESARRVWWIGLFELSVTSTLATKRVSESELRQTRGNMSDREWIEALPRLYPSAAFQASLDSYRKDMENLSKDQLRALREIAQDAIVPPFLVYIAGLIIAWIIAGFRKPPLPGS